MTNVMSSPKQWIHECATCALIAVIVLCVARLGSCGYEDSMSWEGQGLVSRSEYRSEYSRSGEVRQQCRSYLTDLAHDPGFRTEMEIKKWRITNELTFLNGGWEEVSGKKPLIPTDIVASFQGQGGFRLASLWVTDVDVSSGYSVEGNIVNVSAVLQIGFSTERSLSYMQSSSFGGFQVYPGFSLLSIPMEGVYAELKGGERLLCMLGSSELPVRGNNVSEPWDWVSPVLNGSTRSPPLVNDSQLNAVVHYPKDLTLTSRQVSGRLESGAGLFDPVDLFSQLGAYSNYQFVAGGMVDTACAGKDIQPGEVSRPPSVYQGNEFCAVVQQFLAGQWVDVNPNWNCSSSEKTCNKLGPFLPPENDESSMPGGFNGSHLLVQDIRCVDYQESDNSSSANMSAVIRAVLPSQNKNLAFERSTLDTLTLAAEGKWNSRSGELCMMGCRGGNKKPICEMRICMFIPLTLSLIQRSVLKGSIAGLKDAAEDFYPLSFHLPIYPLQLPRSVVSSVSYQYSKINDATAFMDEDESDGIGDQIKKSFLEYPSSNLFEDLSLRSLAITNPNTVKGPHLKQYVKLDVLAINDHVRLHWVKLDSNYTALESEEEMFKPEETYKVAVQLTIDDDFRNKVMTLSAEGRYDPTTGKMYMVGCRELIVPRQILQENRGLLVNGLDCSLQLRVAYPPTNARWLMNPTVELIITSSRNSNDSFFLKQMELETFPILYKQQREEIISRKSLEGGLSMLTLSLILGCLVSQLIYIKSHVESAPYISLLMLAVQGVGFGIPLITGVEALFARMTSDGEDMRESVLNEGKGNRVIGYMVNLLTLAAFLLTLRIVQKVYKSRIRLLSRRPLEPWRVPSDKRVLAICLGIHVLGFVSVLIIHTIRLSQRPISSSLYMDWWGRLHKQYDWEMILKEYYGLVQDLFLLPQVVGNHIWMVRGKPLRSLFYIGVTVLRLLPHIYDGLRPAVFNPYFADEFQYANPSSDFYSKAADIAIPLFAVLLAIIVYVQQRWNGLKWAKVLRQSSNQLMRMGSKMYERLPSKSFEAEMVESVTGEHVYDKENLGNGLEP